VIASGGVGGIEDLRALRERAEGSLEGVIVGRALYDGRVALAEALDVLGR
jgi:phosphoribosylformimino-5-aminoimidazole carboxamide ribonucleotide (ProFAR) isomerase